jgi:hypothetical protein
MIEIKSYLRDSGGRFTAVDSVTATPRDPLHVEGAVELTINGVQIMDTEMWDDVDQLWAYLSRMIPALREQGQASTFFPDQPIELTFRRQGKSRVLVTLEINGKTRTAATEERSLIEALRVHGSAFFNTMIRLLPDNKDVYEKSLARLNQG